LHGISVRAGDRRAWRSGLATLRRARGDRDAWLLRAAARIRPIPHAGPPRRNRRHHDLPSSQAGFATHAVRRPALAHVHLSEPRGADVTSPGAWAQDREPNVKLQASLAVMICKWSF